MNNKGFTLIELLVTIALLGIIAIISFVSINKVIEKNKINECITEVDSIKIAASEYVSDNRYKNNFNPDNLRYINLDSSVLIDGNYLKEGSIYEPGSKKEFNLNEIGISVKLNDDYTSAGIDVYYMENGDKKLYDCKKTVESEVDNNDPTMTVSVKDGTTYEKSKVATVTLHDAGAGLKKGTYKIKYGWGTSSISCSSMTNFVNVDISEEGVISKSVDITIDEKTGAGKIYICNNTAISDVLGNKLNSSTVKNDSMYLDNTGPTAIHTLDLDNNTNMFNSTITNLNDSNSGGASIVGYYIGKNISECSTDDSKYNLSQNINYDYSNTYSGTKWAACVKLKDRLGNMSYIRAPYETFDISIIGYKKIKISNFDIEMSIDRISYSGTADGVLCNTGSNSCAGSSNFTFSITNNGIYSITVSGKNNVDNKERYFTKNVYINSCDHTSSSCNSTVTLSGNYLLDGEPFTYDNNVTASASLNGNQLSINASGGNYYKYDADSFACYPNDIDACPSGGRVSGTRCVANYKENGIYTTYYEEYWYNNFIYTCENNIVIASKGWGNHGCYANYLKDYKRLPETWPYRNGDSCPEDGVDLMIPESALYWMSCTWQGDYNCLGDYTKYYKYTVGVELKLK